MINENYAEIMDLISACEKKYARAPQSVTLLAASKSQPLSKIIAAYDAGVRHFGENYLQEALEKIALLSDKQITWHFIGFLQSNKTRKIAEHFSWVHSVASKKVVERLNAERPAHLPPLNICIEVNVDDEASKSGVLSENVLPLAEFCKTQTRLNLRGLMCIPKPCSDFAKQRMAFHKLVTLADKLQATGIELDSLSMGMSDDFAAAIAEGATIIRIGTRLFGARPVRERPQL